MALKSRFEQQIRLPVLPSWAWRREQLKKWKTKMLFRNYFRAWSLLNLSCLWVVILHVPCAPTSCSSPLWWRVTVHGSFCSQAHPQTSDRSLPGSPGLRRRTAPFRADMGFVMTKISSTAPAKSKQSGHSLDEVFSHGEICSPHSQLQTVHTLPLFPEVHAA